MISPHTNVKDFGAKGDGKTDDTLAIQKAINSLKIVDLSGGTYLCSQLVLKSYSYVRNGKIISRAAKNVLYARNAENITIENIEIDGLSSSETGIFIWGGSRICISGCYVHDMKTIDESTNGIYFKDVHFSNIIRSRVSNIVAIPNGITGDGSGAARGLLIEKCSNVTFDLCDISFITSDEDGDGVHFIGVPYSKSEVEIESNASNVITNSIIRNCTKRSIKIQQSGVIVSNNRLISDEQYTHTTPMTSSISVYASNVKIENNTIDAQTAVPIGIGSPISQILINVSVVGNRINNKIGSYQGCIHISSSSLVENVLVDSNFIDGDSGVTADAVKITTYFKNIRITNNYMTSVVYGVHVGNISDGVDSIEGVSVRQHLLISSNVAVVKYNMYYDESTVVTENVNVVRNIITITNPLSYAKNSIRLSASQLDGNTFVGNNTVNTGFSDGVSKQGTTRTRPTSGLYVGFVFFDTTLSKPIWWTGSKWVDSTGSNA